MNSHKKGFIFTLDLLLGVIIIFVLVGISAFFVTRGSESDLVEYQSLVLGSDIIDILDRQKTFDSLDHTTIETAMEDILPANYEMLIRIEGDFDPANGTIEVGGNLPQDRRIIFGRKVLLTENNIYLKVTYALWVSGE